MFYMEVAMKSKRKASFEAKENERLSRMLHELSENYRALQIESANKDTLLAEKDKQIARLTGQVDGLRETYEHNIDLAKKARMSCDIARKRYLDLAKEYEKEMSAWMKAVRSTAV